MQKIKMIALDLDGTVFNDDKEISKKNREAIQKAIDAGVVVMPATGRHLFGLPEQLISIPGMQYAVTCNGAAIYDLKTKQLIYQDAIAWDEAADIVKEQMTMGNIPEIYADGQGYIDEIAFERMMAIDIPPVLKDYARKSKIRVKNLEGMIRSEKKNSDKIHMLFDRRYPQIRQEAFLVMQTHPHLTVGSAYPYNMEVNKDTANKGVALLKLGEMLGIARDEIMAIGDGENDLVMLQTIGFPVAMGNAVDVLKDCAKAVTLDNNHDGVAAAIEAYVL